MAGRATNKHFGLSITIDNYCLLLAACDEGDNGMEVVGYMDILNHTHGFNFKHTAVLEKLKNLERLGLLESRMATLEEKIHGNSNRRMFRPTKEGWIYRDKFEGFLHFILKQKAIP